MQRLSSETTEDASGTAGPGIHTPTHEPEGHSSCCHPTALPKSRKGPRVRGSLSALIAAAWAANLILGSIRLAGTMSAQVFSTQPRTAGNLCKPQSFWAQSRSAGHGSRAGQDAVTFPIHMAGSE